MSIINLILTVSYRANLESYSMPKSSPFVPENSEEHILVGRYNHAEKEKFRDTFISKCTTNFVFRNKEVIKLLKIIIIIIIIIICMDVSMYVFIYSQIVGKYSTSLFSFVAILNYLHFQIARQIGYYSINREFI